MKQKQDFFQTLSSLFFVIAGNFLYALTVKLFLLPSGLVTGGTTGIALTIQHFFGVSVTQFVLAFNVIMLIAGYLILGRQFAATTLASTFLYPFALEIFDRVFGNYIITDDLLLCTIFSGLGIGIALGIVIRSGASTGGMDIPPLILHKTFRIPVSGSMYAFDVLILLGQALFRPAENILYGIVLVMIYTIVLDKLLLIGTTRTELKIVSQKSDEIRNAILEQIDRGVTLLDGESGYFRDKTQVILSVISKRELPKVEKLVRSIDPESFMVVSRVNEVSGRGFSMKKKYR
ncbi:MAG: YitT family protein [Dorea sp.]|uniref:YitT family protein n=1 Tax=Faecalicatena contorta TaxID=39482 RepID=UPI001F2F0ABF|nr:YitT family protein [Faecalicatena contorta]MCF2681519.1 YitT family protein [Faecalicatena contorta]MCI6059704.1 YitT family protein [Dorea sp.]